MGSWPQVKKRKWVTRKTTCHTWKNGPYLKEWVTFKRRVNLGNTGHGCKNGLHLQKWVTVEQMSLSYKRVSQLKKSVTLGKMGDT